jgi:hypothetical protein
LRDGAETFEVALQVCSRKALRDTQDPNGDKRLLGCPAIDRVSNSINSIPADASQAVKNLGTRSRSSNSKV